MANLPLGILDKLHYDIGKAFCQEAIYPSGAMSDKPFYTLSGPWSGWSIQEGFRLSERMKLTISRRAASSNPGRDFAAVNFPELKESDQITSSISIFGTGTDIDGEFEIEGVFDPISLEVLMTRRYTRAPKNPGQVGFPFSYKGRWNGYCVYGTWSSPTDLDTCGPFEMWPESQGELEELSLEELLATGPMPAGV